MASEPVRKTNLMNKVKEPAESVIFLMSYLIKKIKTGLRSQTPVIDILEFKIHLINLPAMVWAIVLVRYVFFGISYCWNVNLLKGEPLTLTGFPQNLQYYVSW